MHVVKQILVEAKLFVKFFKFSKMLKITTFGMKIWFILRKASFWLIFASLQASDLKAFCFIKYSED